MCPKALHPRHQTSSHPAFQHLTSRRLIAGPRASKRLMPSTASNINCRIHRRHLAWANIVAEQVSSTGICRSSPAASANCSLSLTMVPACATNYTPGVWLNASSEFRTPCDRRKTMPNPQRQEPFWPCGETAIRSSSRCAWMSVCIGPSDKHPQHTRLRESACTQGLMLPCEDAQPTRDTCYRVPGREYLERKPSCPVLACCRAPSVSPQP